MKIRKATISDIEQIAQVHIACWRTTYNGIVPSDFLDNKLSWERSKKNWENTLKNFPDNILLVAETEAGEIVGFCGGGKSRHKDKIPQFEGELMAIYILRDYQKKGIGTVLVKCFVEELLKKNIRNMIIWVLAENDSKRFYEKLGGKYLSQKVYSIGGKNLIGFAYGFEDFKKIMSRNEKMDLNNG